MENLFGKSILSGTDQLLGTGWLPPKPDLRDFTSQHEEIAEMNLKLGINGGSDLPDKVDG